MDYSVKPLYSIGDLVITRVPENQVWRILGYYTSASYENGESAQVVNYEIECVATGNNIESIQKNLMLVCKEAFASEYVKLVNEDGSAPQYPLAKILSDIKSKPQQEEIRTPTRFRGSKEVDELLDKIIAFKVAQEDLGIDYEEEILEVKDMLRWLQEEVY